MQQQLQLTRNKLEINKYLTQYFLLEQNQQEGFLRIRIFPAVACIF